MKQCNSIHIRNIEINILFISISQSIITLKCKFKDMGQDLPSEQVQ